MAILQATEPTPTSTPTSSDPIAARLEGMREQLAEFVREATIGEDVEVSDADRIDRVAALEALRASVAALQAAESVRFAKSQTAEQMTRDVHPRDIGRGVVEQIALARRISPYWAARQLGSARAWWFDLPKTYAALTAGELSERVAEAVVTETRHLDAAARRQVDAALGRASLPTLEARRAIALARRHAYEADPHAYLARARTERKNRRVGLRPAPDTMSILSGFLPVEQGVACLAALRAHTDGLVAGGDERTRDQIMADTLVERVTGQDRASDVNVEVQIVMPLSSLLDPTSPESATLNGGGPLPTGLAEEILGVSRGRKTWRRLFTSAAGHLVGADRRRRRFRGALARLIAARDQVCRDPFCGAPIRQTDHVVRYADGGPTTFPNGRGACVRHNLVREQAGWQVRLVHDGLGDQPHTVEVITPTRHHYLSTAPDPP